MLAVSSHLGRGWRILWTQSRKDYGQADAATGEIEFSQFLLRRLSVKHFTEIVMHEVAHALVDRDDPMEEDHGPRWRATMRELGHA